LLHGTDLSIETSLGLYMAVTTILDPSTVEMDSFCTAGSLGGIG
jgi:hypothetical protein